MALKKSKKNSPSQLSRPFTNRTQPVDDLYYTVFESVKAHGEIIAPQFQPFDDGETFDELATTLWKWRRGILKMLKYEEADGKLLSENLQENSPAGITDV